MDEEDDTIIEELDTKQVLKNLAIFDRQTNNEPIPEGYTAATLRLDARPQSSLNWLEEYKEAKALVAAGYKISFELDLGLDFRPNLYQTHALALDEFCKRFLQPFHNECASIILLRKEGIFSSVEEIAYLELLRQELPDDIVTLLLFDCKTLQDPYSFSCTFNQDRLCQFTLALANAPLLVPSLCWKEGNGLYGYIGRNIGAYAPQEVSCGLIVPRSTTNSESLKPYLSTIQEPFKLISEDFLPLEWEGLDELYVKEDLLAATSLRTIAGFEATGGIVHRLS